ncbi:MAG: PAS domain S-box protein [Anaerolineae bacterium]
MAELILRNGAGAAPVRVDVAARENEGLLALDSRGSVVAANDAACRILGIPPALIEGMPFMQVFSTWHVAAHVLVDGVPRLLRAQSEPLTVDGDHLLLMRFLDESAALSSDAGLIETLQERDRLLALSQEMRLAQISVLEDQLEAQEALRESERFLRAALDGLTAHIAILDEEGRILLVNRAWRDFGDKNGARPEDIGEGSNYLLVCDRAGGAGSDQGRAFAEGTRGVFTGEHAEFTMEYPCDSPDEVRRFIARVTPFPGAGPRRVVVAHENITERVLAEESVRESEQHYRNLADSSSALIWTSDEQGATNYWNQRWIEYAGADALTDPDGVWISLLHPDDAEHAIGAFEEALKRRERFRMVYRLRRHDGVYRWFQDDAYPRYDHQGIFLGYIGHLTDITENHLAEERIAHLNGVLRSVRDINQLIVRVSDEGQLIDGACELLGNMPDYASSVVVLVDGEKRPTTWASRGSAEFRWALDALFGSGQIPDCCRNALQATGALMLGDRERRCVGCPFLATEADHSAMWACLQHDGVIYGYMGVQTLHALGIDEEEQSLIVEMAGDVAYSLHNLAITRASAEAEDRRRALEQQLQQAQRVESVGRLAGGVAHDFNNMLSVILGNLELAMSALPPDHPVRADLQEAEKAGRRSADLTRQLLAFARQQTIAPRVFDLNEALEGMLKMLRRLIGEDIEVVWRPHASVWPLRMDPSQLDQVLANLAVNARDAIGGHGTVTIETNNVTLTEARCAEIVGSAPGDYVMLSVSDSGSGMTPEVRAHLFEPFYTTKGVGEGTGLGLATVYGVVTQNGGFIQVESEPGQGATFHIYLPRHPEETAPEAPARAEVTPRGAGELVLLVEDETAILQMGTRMLELLGYEVVAAGNPRTVLQLAEAQERPPALLITDVVMPGMNGHDLAEQLRERFPDLRVLYMSGYTADVIAIRGVLEEGVHFVGKPFSLKMLGEAVSEALNGGG